RVCVLLKIGTWRTEIKLRYSQSRAGRVRTKVMMQTSRLTIEHVVVESTRSYEVKAALEERVGVLANADDLARDLESSHPSLDEVTKVVEKQLGSSGFSIFSRVEQGQLLSLLVNPHRAIQYAVGNPLLAIQMIAHVPEVALYARLRLTVYEGDQ